MNMTHPATIAWLLLGAACSGAPSNVATPSPTSPAGPTKVVVEPDEGEGGGDVAIANLVAKSGSEAGGQVMFLPTPSGVNVVASVFGASPGLHGIHLHEAGNCDSPDGKSAGGHWNPAAHEHGTPGVATHAGDLGNIEINDDGTGTLELLLPGRTLEGPMGVIGKAVIVHADADDMTSQPSGNAGARIACGVVKANQ